MKKEFFCPVRNVDNPYDVQLVPVTEEFYRPVVPKSTASESRYSAAVVVFARNLSSVPAMPIVPFVRTAPVETPSALAHRLTMPKD